MPTRPNSLPGGGDGDQEEGGRWVDADGWLGGRACRSWCACQGSRACLGAAACQGSPACLGSCARRGLPACSGVVACRGSPACLDPRTCLATHATYLGAHVSLRRRVCLCTSIGLCTPVCGAPTPAPSPTPRFTQPRPHRPREGRAQGLRETQRPPLLVREQYGPYRVLVRSGRVHHRQPGRLRARPHPARGTAAQGVPAARAERRTRPTAASTLGRQHKISEVLQPPPHVHHCAKRGALRPPPVDNPLWTTPGRAHSVAIGGLNSVRREGGRERENGGVFHAAPPPLSYLYPG
jgi:hypothetical protein